MRIPLRIIRTQLPRREAVAWFVFGRSSVEWLSALADWNVPLESVLFRIVPRSAGDRTPIGVLVTFECRASANGSATTGGPIGIPYGCLARRLFLPVDADIWPQVTESDLSALLVDDSDYVFHASIGLIRYEAADRMRAVDLIEAAVPVRSQWAEAVPGIAITTRLFSIEPTVRQSADEILQQAGQDIGNQGDSLQDLPPAPGEGIAGQLYQLTRPLRNAWKSLTRPKQPKAHLPVSPKQELRPGTGKAVPEGNGWLGWIGMAIAPLAAAGGLLSKAIPKSIIDQGARLREVDRLLHLLQNDPDSGLRFALPMGGEAAGRGVAAPSNQLLARNTDFGLAKLIGGGPVDPWAIPPNQQFQLIQMYRELAAREIRLGRHRRAAYIFAELLGDLAAAANALEAGLHFREAATLFRDRLKRPLDAARCLERGGLLNDAAALYLELGMIENAADLYLRLEQREEAERLLRNWIDQLVDHGHHLKASTVLETKLRDVDGALTVLDAGWNRQTDEAETCLTNWFTLLGQHGRQDDARRRLAHLRHPGTSGPQVPALARVLSTVARGHVSQAVRDDAADTARIVVARELPSASVQETKGLLNAIAQLALHDRLLTRDCNRFVTLKEQANRRQIASPNLRPAGITSVRNFELEGIGIQWKSAKSNSEAMYAVGHTQGGLVLRRISWLTTWIQNHQSIYWGNVSPDRQILLEVPHGRSNQVLIHVVGESPLTSRTFIGGATVSGVEHAGSPSWATTSTVALAYSDGGAFGWRVRSVFGTLELAGFGPNSDEVTNGLLRLSVTEENLANLPVTICATAKPVRIGVGQVICRPLFSSESSMSATADATRLAEQFVEVDAIIHSLHNYRDSETDCVVALFDAGGVMVPEPIQKNYRRPIADGMISPTGAFLGNGIFVVAGDRDCRAYSFAGHKVRELGTVSLEHPAVAVTPTNAIGQFAVLQSNGRVQVFLIEG